VLLTLVRLCIRPAHGGWSILNVSTEKKLNSGGSSCINCGQDTLASARIVEVLMKEDALLG